MLKYNSSVLNIYALLIKQQRLIICACFGFLCIFLLNCSKKSSEQAFKTQNPTEISASAININSADAAQFEKLPGIGKETARKIIEHRERFGAFHRAENLILVRGMSDKKFREIRSSVKVE